MPADSENARMTAYRPEVPGIDQTNLWLAECERHFRFCTREADDLLQRRRYLTLGRAVFVAVVMGLLVFAINQLILVPATATLNPMPGPYDPPLDTAGWRRLLDARAATGAGLLALVGAIAVIGGVRWFQALSDDAVSQRIAEYWSLAEAFRREARVTARTDRAAFIRAAAGLVARLTGIRRAVPVLASWTAGDDRIDLANPFEPLKPPPPVGPGAGAPVGGERSDRPGESARPH